MLLRSYNYLERKNTLARLGFGDKTRTFEFRVATPEETASTHERRGYPGLKKIIVVSPRSLLER